MVLLKADKVAASNPMVGGKEIRCWRFAVQKMSSIIFHVVVLTKPQPLGLRCLNLASVSIDGITKSRQSFSLASHGGGESGSSLENCGNVSLKFQMSPAFPMTMVYQTPTIRAESTAIGALVDCRLVSYFVL